VNKAIYSTAIALLLCSTPAQAQMPGVTLAFNDGTVTIAASDALLSDVLAEWARVGGTEISGAERLPAARVTISLAGVPEAEAIDAVLGSTAGYISALRSDAAPGTSWLRKLQVVVSSGKAAASVRLTRVVDASIPESKFEYAAPDVDADTLIANVDGMPPQSPALTQPQVMPELRFQYSDPSATIPAWTEQPDEEPETKPEPKTKKPPSGM
jgi:hypothetical protein